MKKFSLFFAMIIASLGFFTSCDDTADPNATPVTVTVTNLTVDPTYATGDKIDYKIVVTQNDIDLKTFVATASMAGGTGTGIDMALTDPNGDIFDTDGTTIKKNQTLLTVYYSYVVPAAAAEGTGITLTFSATDKDGNTGNETAEFEVGVNSTPFAGTETPGSIGHKWGPDNGGWNFTDNAPVIQANWDTKADILNTSEASGSAFIAGWESKTGYTFAKAAAGYDYAAATLNDAAAATYGATVTGVAANDIYFAKKGDFYVLIKITEVSSTGNLSKAGEGYLKYVYKVGTFVASK